MKELFQKKSGWLPLLTSVLLASSAFFLFGPLRMYILNITRMWFPMRDILMPTAAMFLITAALLFAAGMLLFRVRRPFRIYICLLFAAGVMLFVQGWLIPDKYGVLTESVFRSRQNVGRLITDTDLWLCAAAVSLVLAKTLKKRFDTLVAIVSVCVILAQLILFAALCVKTDFDGINGKTSYLSSKNLFSLSGEKNVVVIVTDGFDQTELRNITDETPGRMEIFDGFTVFENMTGEYPDAKGAVPFILTGSYYENTLPYSEYIAAAWEEAAARYDVLKSDGYRIGIYTQEAEAVSDGAGAMIDNFVSAKVVTSSAAELEKALVRLTAMRFFPGALKRCVWGGGEVLDGAKTAEETEYPRYRSGTRDFLDGLVSEGLTADEKQPVFLFIHLDGSSCRTDAEETGENEPGVAETRANGYLNVLEEFVARLKELGIYDSTMMIVTGGHGSEEAESNPVLLAKDFGKSGPPEISHAPVSGKNIFAAVMELEEYEEQYGKSLFGVVEGDGAERRYFLYALNADETLPEDRFPDMTEYMILPDGSGAEYYRPTGRIFAGGGVLEQAPYAAKIGTPVTFGTGEAIAHFAGGISAVSEKYADENGNVRYCNRALGNGGKARFDFGDGVRDLFCRIEICGSIPGGRQRVVVSAKGTVLFDAEVSADRPYIDFLIPEQCFDGSLLTLEFEYPEARYSSSHGRAVSVAFAEIMFTETEKTDRIDLTRYGDAERNLRSGWYGQEDAWRWSGEKAEMQVLLFTDEDSRMSVRYWTHPGAGDTKVYYNGRPVGVLPHHEEGDGSPVSLTLPAAYRNESGAQTISFETAGAISSKEYYGGGETDDRVLGIAVSEIGFARQD
jgi:hypothetical protein